MILYYGITHYHFLCAMLHKMKYHKSDEAVLLIPERINDSRKLKDMFEKAGIFSGIELYSEPRVDSSHLSPAGVSREIDRMVQHVEKEFPVDLREFEEINVADDHYAFGTYLVKKGIHYNFFEDGCGRLSTEKELIAHVKKLWPIRELIIQELKLIGNAEVVDHRYGDLKSQKPGYANPKDVHFSVPELLKERTEEEIACIIRAFTGEASGKSAAGGNLLLTQHFINLNLMNYAEQKLLYQTLADYFAEEGELVIKPHPSDIQGVYRSWFPNAMVLDRMLPAELLPYCTSDGKYKTGICASSTSVHNLSEYFEETVCFSQMIEKSYVCMNQYYMALRCIERLQITPEDRLFLAGGGINQSQLSRLSEHYGMNLSNWKKVSNLTKVKKEKVLGRKIVLVTNVTEKNEENNIRKFLGMLQNMEDRDVVLLLPDGQRTMFATERTVKELQHILPIAVDTFGTGSGKRERIGREFIYLYTRDNSQMQEVLGMSERKVLKYSGVEIEVNPSEQTEVKILEGINEALEKRVTELSEEYKKLKKKVKEYEEFKESKAYKVTCFLRHFIRPEKEKSDKKSKQ